MCWRRTMMVASVFISVLVVPLVCLLTLLLVARFCWKRSSGNDRVQVVVLGDVGRSPRMQYHSLSLIGEGFVVDLVGFGGSSLIHELRESPQLIHHKLTEPPSLKGLPRLIHYIVKVAYQTINLFWVLLIRTKKPCHMIVQTPPSIPTTFVAVVMCYLRDSRLIMDYHNYGHTILSLSLGNCHPIVKVSEVYETILSRFAYASLCVSKAMKRDMQDRMNVSAIVFYDRPPRRFRPTNLEERHKLFKKLGESFRVFRVPTSDPPTADICSDTTFTQVNKGCVELRRHRPFLLISSTSWTEDEDFSILLGALEGYNAAVECDKENLPNMVCIITGKGPLKKYYEGIIEGKKFSNVQICTMWLSAEDYPVLLGSADLGVCLHKSSSGLDLPMKVVDMFGCGLPVCAIEFGCLHELLKKNHNGMMFSESAELCFQLQSLCYGFPENKQLSCLRNNLSSFQKLRWDYHWKLNVLPLIKK